MKASIKTNYFLREIKLHSPKNYFVIPAEAGIKLMQSGSAIKNLNTILLYKERFNFINYFTVWIPASAGMTVLTYGV